MTSNMVADSLSPQMDHVKAPLKFLANHDVPLIYIPSKGGGDETDHVGNFSSQEVNIYDGRETKKNSNLDVEGFKLVQHKSQVTDFFSDTQINSTYQEEVTTLVTEITGAKRIEIFDHTRRSACLNRQKETGMREPAAIIHNDYTARSGIKRCQDYFGDRISENNKLMQQRFAIINVWRSIAGTVYNHPLALCDAETLAPESIVSMERRAEERIGEIQVALYHPRQRWYYFPNMQSDEALIFKTFDSAADGRARFTIHSSFEDPNIPQGGSPRESIETRCLVFF